MKFFHAFFYTFWFLYDLIGNPGLSDFIPIPWEICCFLPSSWSLVVHPMAIPLAFAHLVPKEPSLANPLFGYVYVYIHILYIMWLCIDTLFLMFYMHIYIYIIHIHTHIRIYIYIYTHSIHPMLVGWLHAALRHFQERRCSMDAMVPSPGMSHAMRPKHMRCTSGYVWPSRGNARKETHFGMSPIMGIFYMYHVWFSSVQQFQKCGLIKRRGGLSHLEAWTILSPKLHEKYWRKWWSIWKQLILQTYMVDRVRWNLEIYGVEIPWILDGDSSNFGGSCGWGVEMMTDLDRSGWFRMLPVTS